MRMTHYCDVSTPVGRLLLAGDEIELPRVSFQDGRDPVSPRRGWQRTEEPFRDAIAQLDAYFAGQLDRFDLSLPPEGTPFQREAWSALEAISYGETVTYGELARRLGRPAASRAVGAANGRMKDGDLVFTKSSTRIALRPFRHGIPASIAADRSEGEALAGAPARTRDRIPATLR